VCVCFTQRWPHIPPSDVQSDVSKMPHTSRTGVIFVHGAAERVSILTKPKMWVDQRQSECSKREGRYANRR
jgi:hypothetical protein